MTRFDSFIPLQYKQNLVCTLVTRAYEICSNYVLLHRELEFLRKVLNDNGFPLGFTNKHIGKQLNKIRNKRETPVTANRATLYFSIPFLGHRSFSLRNKVKHLVQNFYPQISLKAVFKPQNRLGDIFRFKDVIPSDLKSSVVYHFKCSSCNATYVGQSKRQLRTRISEHKGVSFRTNNRLNKPGFSAIRNHSHEADHPIYTTDFKILFNSSNDTARLLAEALFIKHLGPSLCTQDGSSPLVCC